MPELLGELRDVFADCQDVVVHRQSYPHEEEVIFFYCRSLCEERTLNELVLPELWRVYNLTAFSDLDAIRRAGSIVMEEEENAQTAADSVLCGYTIVCFPRLGASVRISIRHIPQRDTEASNIDVSIRGPKDGLVESIDTNVGLIRKRLPTPSLGLDFYTIGTNSRTRVGLLYLKGKIDHELLNDVRSRLDDISTKVEELASTVQLEEHIADQPYSMFPLSVYTGRADFIAVSLNKGRFAILIDGVPGAMVAPSSLFLLLKTPEDTHFSFLTAAFGQVLRLFSLVLSAFLPSFFIAVTGFHQDQLPFPLLATIVMTRLGIPLSAPMEMFLILFFLELFKEAGYRLPSMIGQTLTVVGGLIIGDAAVRAGLTSPSLVVVAAISMVAGSTLISQTLTGTIGVLRYFSLIFASVLGMYGFLLSVLLVIVYLTGLSSYGVPYLAPITPIRPRDVARALMTLPRKLGGFVPTYLRRSGKGG